MLVCVTLSSLINLLKVKRMELGRILVLACHGVCEMFSLLLIVLWFSVPAWQLYKNAYSLAAAKDGKARMPVH